MPCHAVSADLPTLRDSAWLLAHRDAARLLARDDEPVALVQAPGPLVCPWCGDPMRLNDADSAA